MRPHDRRPEAIGTDDDLSCLELVEIITDYLEGALSPAERSRFEGHLAMCQGCRTYLQQISTTIELAGKLSEESIPEPVKTELLAAFRSFRRG